MALLLNAVGSVIKFGVKATGYIGLVALIGGSIFLHQTKPTNESFEQALTQNADLKGKILAKIALNTVVQPEFKDWVVFKTATLNDNGRKVIFIGAVNNWTHWSETKS